MKTILALGASLLLALFTSAITLSQVTAQSTPVTNNSSDAPTDTGWPRTIEQNGLTVQVYQPQVESWNDNRLDAYSAVSVQADQSKEPTYGIIYFTARTDVDKDNRVVTLEDMNLTKASFPTDPQDSTNYLNIIQQAAPEQLNEIALDRLQADLAITEAEKKVPRYNLRNDPPKIIFSTTPAILVPIDGSPALRPVSGEKDLQRVINTSALILLDQKKNTYYLYLTDVWVQASTVEGPWSYAAKPPHNVEKVRKNLEKNMESEGMSNSNGSDDSTSLKDQFKSGTPPTVYISTVPTQLITTQGQPQFSPIAGTNLTYVANTTSDIFRYGPNQDYYILISGRWFKSRSLDGPWAYVAGNALPQDFARIPQDSPKARVLASIPGTSEAQEAIIANSIPETQTINRSQRNLTVNYDGQPQFNSIDGTSLQYAINCPTPIIEVSSNSYFAVDKGIWFSAVSPTGPWTVAASVPSVIYSIPPNSPLHYVTYVRVYDSTPDVVYTGYTPGYFGTVVSSDDTVVYGTGYLYRPYIGDVWIGYPWTYGFGAGFDWSLGGGWAFDFGFGFGYPFFYPWWEPIGYGWCPGCFWRPGRGIIGHFPNGHDFNHGHDHFPGRGHDQGPGRDHDHNQGNDHGGHIAGSGKGRDNHDNRGPRGEAKPDNRGSDIHARNEGRDNNMFANRDGKIFRFDNGKGWQERHNDGWRSPDSGMRDMDRFRQSRSLGDQRWNNFHSGGGFRGGFGGFRGGSGGFRGGFGGGRGGFGGSRR